MMQDKVGIAREDKGLTDAIGLIREISSQIADVGAGGNRWYNPGWHTALDSKHLLTVSEAIALSARERKESRGSAFSARSPEQGGGLVYLQHVVRKGPDGEMVIERQEIPPMRQELQDIIERKVDGVSGIQGLER